MWIFSCPKRRNQSDVSLVNGEACWSCDRNIKQFSYKVDIILFYRPQLGKMTTLCFVFVPPFESWFCSECCAWDTMYCPLQDRRRHTVFILLRKDGRGEVWKQKRACRKLYHFRQLVHDFQSWTKKIFENPGAGGNPRWLLLTLFYTWRYTRFIISLRQGSRSAAFPRATLANSLFIQFQTQEE